MKILKREDLKSKVNFYKLNGWVKIEEFFNRHEIKKIKNKINLFLESKKNSYLGRDINFVSNRNRSQEINSFHKMHDSYWIKKFAQQKNIIKLVKLFLEKNPELRACEYFAKPQKKGLPAPIHQDNFYWKVRNNKGLTMWIALCSSDKGNGGLYYYNGSHKQGILPHKASLAKGTSQKIKNLNKLKNFKKITPSLKTGDVLIHHALVVHGSKKNKSNRPRKGLTFQFKDKNTNYIKSEIKLYEKSLKRQIEIRV